MLNLGMASQWSTWSRGLSFNGPIWSVSLEVGAYVMFFVSLFLLRSLGIWMAIVLAVLCFLLGSSGISLPLVRLSLFMCASFFFAGTVAYFLHIYIGNRGYLTVILIASLLLIGVLSVATGNERISVMSFSSALLIFAAMLDRIGAIGKWILSSLKALGNLSYSIYLVHVPLQMILLLWFDIFFDQSRAFAESYMTLPIYLLIVVLVSSLVHIHFERPAGRYLRRRLSQNQLEVSVKVKPL
jgi:peptidoglycan/LPS O-acetylase OafA/YrhL